MVVLTLMLATVGCKSPLKNNLPPAAQLMHPGPGVDGPGPGVMMWGAPGLPMPGQASQLAFVGPEGMSISWDISAPGMFDSQPLIAPGRYNFPQGAIYRMKLTEIPGRPGIELYPTIEVAFSMPRTEAYLAHNAVPIQFTEEDLDQVVTGNFVTKVIYLPDAEFQELAVAGVETLVSTRLDPGVDPIVEADRRGSILSIIRIGNKDLQAAGGMVAGEGMGGAGPDGCAPGGLPPGFVAGVTAPQYGMPITGTPIGLPGPPHVPLGIPAGLQRHTMVNHTHYHIPGPTEHVGIHVKHKPGFSYPAPVNKVHITERTRQAWPAIFRQSVDNMHEHLPMAVGTDCAVPPQ
jgi:hypothetical protein